MQEVTIPAQSLDRYVSLVGEEEVRRSQALADVTRERFEGRVIWNINSTAQGGGVAEMLRALLPYARGSGLDMRWRVLSGNPEFFHITKRLHHSLHGSVGDGFMLDDEARAIYEQTLAGEMEALTQQVNGHDIALLHDPQTAGLIPGLVARGVKVIWRCHIGSDAPDEETGHGWDFLAPYVQQAHATVFSRRAYIPKCCGDRSTIIYPSLDPFSPKNQEMEPETVRAILVRAGLVRGNAGEATPTFHREDDSPGRIERKARIHGEDDVPPLDAPLVVQVSRWDQLKDHAGVARGFARLLSENGGRDIHLMLVGPDTESVADDPEGKEALADVLDVVDQLPEHIRARIHPVSLPMDDVEENAAMVNALQRHATVVVQKSLAEGFGLTVTEAMAKGRPVLASAIGGIVEQIADGVHGRLLDDPADEAEFATVLASMLADPEEARAMGERARERVEREFFGLRALRQFATLFAEVDDRG